MTPDVQLPLFAPPPPPPPPAELPYWLRMGDGFESGEDEIESPTAFFYDNFPVRNG